MEKKTKTPEFSDRIVDPVAPNVQLDPFVQHEHDAQIPWLSFSPSSPAAAAPATTPHFYNMRHGTDDHEQPAFNDIRIDLRSGGAPPLNSNPTYYGKRYPPENDQRSQGSVPSRVSRYSEYPQVRPTNPLYSSQSTIRTQGSQPHANGGVSSKSSATLVNRRQKFDPQAPRRPSDWRWLAILCIILFFPLGLFAFAFARKAQNKFHDGFVMDSHKLNKRALVLCILSILCGIALIIGLLFGFDAWPRTNG